MVKQRVIIGLNLGLQVYKNNGTLLTFKQKLVDKTFTLEDDVQTIDKSLLGLNMVPQTLN